MTTHKQLTEKLKKAMREDYHSVHPEKNPVAVAVPQLSDYGLRRALSQYTIFPKNIVSFLEAACDTSRESDWTKIADELTRNIGEELGTETGGIIHYDMLVKGLADGLDSSLEGYLRNLLPSSATEEFVQKVRTIAQDQQPAYAVGGTYALESSAVPELVIVRDALNELFTRATGQPMQDGMLKEFFRRHLDIWEPGHEEGLREASAKYILGQQDKKLFEAGFRNVMSTMDAWWIGLYKESRDL